MSEEKEMLIDLVGQRIIQGGLFLVTWVPLSPQDWRSGELLRGMGRDGGPIM